MRHIKLNICLLGLLLLQGYPLLAKNAMNEQPNVRKIKDILRTETPEVHACIGGTILEIN